MKKQVLHKRNLLFLVMFISIFVFQTTSQVDAATAYNVTVVISKAELPYDGDNDGWFRNNPGEIRVQTPSGMTDVGTHEDGMNKIITFSSIYYSTSVLEGGQIQFNLKDHDGGSSYTTLWTGTLTVNGEATVSGWGHSVEGSSTELLSNGAVSLKTDFNYRYTWWGDCGGTQCPMASATNLYFQIFVSLPAPVDPCAGLPPGTPC